MIDDLDMKRVVGTRDIVWITLDTLRYDVAERARVEGKTPFLASVLRGPWEQRHTSGSFTYAAHQAFFAGFLPTPLGPGPHPRRFAAAFPGSETTAPETFVFDAADVPTGLANAGYHTICVGGVGFFNRQTALGRVLPDLFRESHWSPALGVTARASTDAQVDVALAAVRRIEPGRRVFLFLNVSAIHQPNRIYVPGAERDGPDTMSAALAYVDGCLRRLFEGLLRRAPLYAVVMSDHGTAYGEDGLWGHRLGHPVVWTVPFGEVLLDPERAP